MLCERDNGRSCSCTLCILNDLRSLALHDGDTRVCCAEINADDGACKNASKMCGIDMKRQEGAPDTLVFMLRAMAERGKPYASFISLCASVQPSRAKIHVPRTGQFAVKRKQLSDERQQTCFFRLE